MVYVVVRPRRVTGNCDIIVTRLRGKNIICFRQEFLSVKGSAINKFSRNRWQENVLPASLFSFSTWLDLTSSAKWINLEILGIQEPFQMYFLRRWHRSERGSWTVAGYIIHSLRVTKREIRRHQVQQQKNGRLMLPSKDALHFGNTLQFWLQCRQAFMLSASHSYYQKGQDES